MAANVVSWEQAMKEKSRKNDLQSEDREFPVSNVEPSQEPRVMSFDVYFQKMLAENPKVQKHHKSPMQHFAEQKGLRDGTEEQFDEIFRSY